MLKKIKVSLLSLPLLALVDFAQAAEAAKPQGAGSMLWLPLILVAVFYFLIIRPQNKRQKEQKELTASVGLGDEVMTASGIIGKVTRLRDDYVVISINKENEITFSRSAITQVLPKGTIEGLN